MTDPTAPTSACAGIEPRQHTDLEQVRAAAREAARRFPPMSGELVKLVRNILRNSTTK
ncbi:MAG TPA: hypothetical protein GXZ45_13970 [Propionibacterium sp.]|nr:hypothetical protein [Propionibacterium sp.]